MESGDKGSKKPDVYPDLMDRSPNVADAGRHTGSISVARGQGVRSDCIEATITHHPGYVR